MRLQRLFTSALVLAAIISPLGVVSAHDSPEHSVEELTEHIEQFGASVPLLLRRAGHYRALGEREKAIADLNNVLLLEPKHLGAHVELARIHQEMSKADEGLQFIQRAIEMSPGNEKDKAHLYATRADIYLTQGTLTNALNDYNRALAADGTQVDWYLNRSWIQEQLGRSHDRILGLAKGHAMTHSVVLQTQWIEALIDGGQAPTALRILEPHLQQARLQSSWLIRRARARLALQNQTEPSEAACYDLESAIQEINGRLHPTRPDTDLLLDRAQAFLLLNNVEAAQKDAKAAKTLNANPRQLARLERQLERYITAKKFSTE